MNQVICSRGVGFQPKFLGKLGLEIGVYAFCADDD